MARKDQVTEGPFTKVVFRETAADTHGELLRFEQVVQPGYEPPPVHIHSQQSEYFEVVAGRMGARLDGQERILEAGDAITIPAGAPHTFWNAGDTPLHQVIELRPALASETFFETVVGLERDGKLDRRDPRTLLQMAQVFLTYDSMLTSPPRPVQVAVFRALSALGKLLGYRAWYPRYSPYGPVTP